MEEFLLSLCLHWDICSRGFFFLGGGEGAAGGIVMVMINWSQDFVSSNSVRNYTRDYQFRLPIRGRPITCTITDRTPLSPITINNQNYSNILERDWLSPARFEH